MQSQHNDAHFASATPPHLTIIQHNTAKSNDVFLSLFSSFNKNSPPQIVAIQEPFLFRKLPLPAPGYSLIHPPPTDDSKIAVAFYISKEFETKVSYVPRMYGRTDMIALVFSFPHQHVAGSLQSLTIVNVYNRILSATARSVPPRLAFPHTTQPTLVVGDFNIHHHIPDPLRALSHSEKALGTHYFDEAHAGHYTLLNTPGSRTRLSPHILHRNSCIDLAFANDAARSAFQRWDNNRPASGSDHNVIAVLFSHPGTRQAAPSPNWALVPWGDITAVLKEHTISPPAAPAFVEEWFQTNLDFITQILTEETPTKRPSRWSKAWWNPNISELRRIHHAVTRRLRKGEATIGEAKAAKYAYFKSIKAAKAAHWNAFTANADLKDLWAASRLKRPKDPDNLPSFPNITDAESLNDTLISHFFPPKAMHVAPRPKNYQGTPPVSQEEIKDALKSSSNTSTPGPDSIPYGVWKIVNKINPAILPSLLSPLLEFGVHPESFKRFNGIILPKPNKPNYTEPSSFRIIVLLQTIAKILERIVAMRLTRHALESGLIHRTQCGSLPGRCVADAALVLLQEVRTLQAAKQQVSSLFLDIKGGFDNVSSPILCARLRAHNTPEYIVAWVASFLANRSCRLLFKGGPMKFSQVAVGTPQGSPISPLIFCIYVAPLHIAIPRTLFVSYVDDFCITVSSPTRAENINKLTDVWRRLRRVADRITVPFSLPKTDLIHWSSARQRTNLDLPSLQLDADNTIHPTKCIKWLGLWFSDNLSTFEHFKRRTEKATRTFQLIRSLSPPGSGLTSHNNRKLAQAIILPSLLYGADVFAPNNSSLKMLATCWHQVLRWVTNMFRNSNLHTLYPEACLPPIQACCHRVRLLLARRIAHASPANNPASARLPPTFYTRFPDRANSHRNLLIGIPNGPPVWNIDSTISLVGRPQMLPIDQLCRLLLKLFLPSELSPTGGLPSVGQHLIDSSVLTVWSTLFPPPAYYKYPIPSRPHKFMTADRFISGRLHQMRSHSSYLAAHIPWFAPTQSPICPRCTQGDETLDHAIFKCPARAKARKEFLPRFLTTEKKLWKSAKLLHQLAKYIRTTRTGYPHEWAGWYPLSLSGPSDVLSSVSSDDEGN